MSEDRAETGAGAAPAPVCYRHAGRETYVSCTRCERPICPDCMKPAAVGFQCPECIREGNKSVRAARTAFGGSLDGAQGLVTKILMGLNVGIFVLTVLTAGLNGVDNAMRALTGQGGSSVLYEWFSMIPLALNRSMDVVGVADGEYWRLVTAGFLHYGLIHLLLNMWALSLLGGDVERLVGRWRFLAVYLLSGLGGSVAVYLFDAQNVALAGASGSVFGLLGALFFFFRKLNQDPRGLLLLIALNFGLGLFISNISWLGHLGGLIVGALTGLVLAYAPKGPQRTAIQVTGLVAVGVVLVVLVLVRTAQLAI